MKGTRPESYSVVYFGVNSAEVSDSSNRQLVDVVINLVRNEELKIAKNAFGK